MFRRVADRLAPLAALLVAGVATCRAEEPAQKTSTAVEARMVIEKQLTLFERWKDDPAAAEAALGLASKENRARIGSVERFRGVLETPNYRPLINNHGWLCGDAAPFEGGRVALVTMMDRSGSLAVFRYYVRPDASRPDSAWAIDAVVRVPVEGGSEPGGR